MPETRTALVTGANRGIGLEVCRQLATLGLRVILSSRDLSKAEAALQSIRSAGHIIAARLDVTDPASIRALAGTQVDVLVNNAAILLDEAEDIMSLAPTVLSRTFETNFFAAVALSQAFAPAMVARGYGRIVNVSSQAGQLASMSTYAPAYSMSKTALNAFTRQLAAEQKAPRCW